MNLLFELLTHLISLNAPHDSHHHTSELSAIRGETPPSRNALSARGSATCVVADEEPLNKKKLEVGFRVTFKF